MAYQSKFSKKFLALTLSAAIVGGAAVPTFANTTGFKDVEAGKWYSEAVNVLSTKSIIDGIGNELFSPDTHMTKAEVVKMIVVAKNLDTENVEAPGFSDVKEGKWYYKYIAAAKEAGIAVGDGTDKFNPEKQIDRSEVASLLVNAYDLSGEGTEMKFTDVTNKDWFFEEVQALVAANLTQGTTTTTFSPKKLLTRAEGAGFVYNAVQKVAADEVQFIFDVNLIEGEGNLADKFSELGYDAFNNLTEVQQTEVAKLFLISKGDTEYKTVEEIITAIDTAIEAYNQLLDTVNEAADATAMKIALEGIAGLFDIEVTEDMANLVFAAKTTEGFASVTEIIAPLQAAIDTQFIFDVNLIEGEGNLADKFSELGYDAFDNLTEVQQTEVAKLFLINKDTTEYEAVAEITAAIDIAIEDYNELLAAVNVAADATAMKAALEDMAELFELVVSEEMSTAVLAAKTTEGFASVTEIIAALQPSAE